MSKRILAKSSCKLCQGHWFFYKRYLFFFITKQTLHLNFQFRLILGLYVKKNPRITFMQTLSGTLLFFYKSYLFFFITKQTLHLNFSISSNTWVICQKESSSMFGCKLGTVRGCVWKSILFSFFEWIDMRVGMKVMFHSLH